MNEPFDGAPVVFIIFNRPDLTKRVFDEIAKARPRRLYIVADGPRADRGGEAAICQKTRDVVEHIDWECEVFRDYSEINLGCQIRVTSGLNWVFSREDRAIIIEDDCLPDQSFFSYCGELLERYKDDTRIGSINGTCTSAGRVHIDGSYFFSRYPLVWGWATWRRVWENYDVEIAKWGELRDAGWLKSVAYEEEFSYWIKAFNLVFERRLNAWGYQLVFSLWRQRQLSVHPRQNLISNLGFGGEATHTKEADHRLANLPRGGLSFPLAHPDDFNASFDADLIHRMENCFRKPKRKLWQKVLGVGK